MDIATQSQLHISLSQDTIFERTGQHYRVTVYGKICNRRELETFDFSRCDKNRLCDLMNRLSGYFLLVYQDLADDTCYVGNDIFGNFRLYYRQASDGIRYSDDWKILADEIAEEHGRIELNEHEAFFLTRQSHTSGGHTLVKGLDKMLPGSLHTLSGGMCSQEIYFRTGVVRERDDEHYKRRNLEYVTENISAGALPAAKNILLFSGGIDSTYLALALRELGLPFTAVFIQYVPASMDNLRDLAKAQAVARHLDIELEVIAEPIKESMHVLDRAVRRHPFDRAFSVPAYRAAEILRDRYGACNLICGQSSDTIYTAGPSGKTIGCILQRTLWSPYYARGHRMFNLPLSIIVGRLYRSRWKLDFGFRVPVSFPDYAAGLLDPQIYLPLIQTDEHRSAYNRYVAGIAQAIAARLRFDTDSIRMYMKMMYIQGSSNIFWVELAKEYGHNLVMPFVDARIVYLKMQYQNELKNIFRPRYVLEEIMRSQFSFDTGIIDRPRQARIDNSSAVDWTTIEKEVRRQWDRIAKELL